MRDWSLTLFGAFMWWFGITHYHADASFLFPVGAGAMFFVSGAIGLLRRTR